MEIPRVDDDAAGVGIVDQHVDLVVVCFGLGKRVVEHDVNVISERPIGVDLGDHDEIAVGVEHVRQSDEHHFIVIDEGDDDGGR